MQATTEKQWCSISRESTEKIARELYELDHPDEDLMARLTGFNAHWDEYHKRVYDFDTAIQRLGFVLVRSA